MSKPKISESKNNLRLKLPSEELDELKFIKMKIQVRITNFALKELTPGQITTLKR